MLIDLHTHTRAHSWDADLGPDELVEAASSAGLDGVCLTEHDFFWDVEAVRALGRRHDFLVLPGVEINTEDGHFLCFGLNSYVYGMHRALELAGHVQRAGGTMIAAHPYRRRVPSKDGVNAERQTEPTEKSWLAEQFSFCVRSALVSRRAVRAMERSFCAARKIGMRALSESRRAAESAALSPARLVSRVGVATRAAARVGD